jgi:hypothetical protein
MQQHDCAIDLLISAMWFGIFGKFDTMPELFLNFNSGWENQDVY